MAPDTEYGNFPNWDPERIEPTSFGRFSLLSPTLRQAQGAAQDTGFNVFLHADQEMIPLMEIQLLLIRSRSCD